MNRKVSVEIRNEIVKRFLAGEKSIALGKEYGLSSAYAAILAKKLTGGRLICCPNCGTAIQAGSRQIKVISAK